MSTPEPISHKSKCAYCGDAPVNHTASYLDSMITFAIDAQLTRATAHLPKFIRKLVDVFLLGIFNILRLFGLAYFSHNIDNVSSFRSRVVWEEAERRGIKVFQIVIFGKPIDVYRAIFPNGKKIYFESIPIRPEFLNFKNNWDDKTILKEELKKIDVPVPFYVKITSSKKENLKNIFSQFNTKIIVKPKIGSRGRHTITNIKDLDQFIDGVKIANQISRYVVAEEHLDGYVCRATVVDGVLAGFYRGAAPSVVGDGKSTISELIDEKDNARPDRVQKILVSDEMHKYISHFGYKIDDVLPEGEVLPLTHRVGRLFGGKTKEMIDELHPSFIPILERAGRMTGLAVAGFDCIVPDPEKRADEQRWGIIECNTLPFIDLHYYALEGKPRNIAGMVWDMWK